MSFKRDGNNSSLLKNLRHRRVTEILGDYIPDDEASLLSNGRLACTVCSKRPVFDTIQMLSLHRKGKKHLLELSIYLQQKRDVEYRKAKQTQKSFLKTSQISLKPHASTYTLIQSQQNQTKRKRYGDLNRKLILDITESCDRIKNSLNPPTVIAPSANSQVRKYLKSLSRKTPLEKTVNKLRENYGAKTDQNNTKLVDKVDHKKKDEKLLNKNSDFNYNIKLLESGWIQDGNGKWIKNPDVEFDSDEEEPPVFS